MSEREEFLMLIGELTVVQRRLMNENEQLKTKVIEMADPFAKQDPEVQESSDADKRE
jgi:hypothetical protein